MAPEAASGASGRPRPALLVALGIAVAILLVWWMSGKSAAPATVASKPKVAAKAGCGTAWSGRFERAARRLEAAPACGRSRQSEPVSVLHAAAPAAAGAAARPAPVPVPLPEGPPVPEGPPPPPPIPLKYIGLLEEGPGKGKIAAFSDCRTTMRGREGEIIGGQYRLVRIGLESVVLEYVDGRGRTTIRMSGQECVGK